MERWAIIRDRGIGDILMLTPSLRAIHEQATADQVTVFTSAEGEMVLKGNPRVYEASAVKSCRPELFDWVVDLKGWAERQPDVGSVSRVVLFARGIGVTLCGSTLPEYYPSRSEVLMARRWLRGLGWRPAMVVAPLATDPRRSWDWAQLGKFVEKALREGYTVVPVHRTDCMDGLPCFDHPHCWPLWGADLRFVAAVVSQVDVVVSVDTAIYHLAVAAGASQGTPKLVLPFGATDASVQMEPYYGVDWMGVKSRFSCPFYPCAGGTGGRCALGADGQAFACQTHLDARDVWAAVEN